jgi:glycine dehydrogenase subunit 1
VYLATVGKHGLRRIAEACYHKAHYAASLIARIPGYEIATDRPFFKEFPVRCPLPPAEINRRLLKHNTIGGLDVSDQVENGMLVCVTEMNTRQELERLAAALEEVGC